MNSPERPARLTGAAREKLAKELREQYVDGASIRAIAKEYELSYGLVRWLLLEAGATLRPGGRTPRHRDVSTEQLVSLYKAGKSLHAIGIEVDMNHSAVRERLLRAGVRLRTKRGRRTSRP